MDVSASTLLIGFLFSTVGFSFFLYGKKQGRMPQLVAGGLMMALPIVVPGALWLALSEIGSLAGLWLSLRLET